MDIALSTVKWQFFVVYLDDIVVLSRSAAELIDPIKHV